MCGCVCSRCCFGTRGWYMSHILFALLSLRGRSIVVEWNLKLWRSTSSFLLSRSLKSISVSFSVSISPPICLPASLSTPASSPLLHSCLLYGHWNKAEIILSPLSPRRLFSFCRWFGFLVLKSSSVFRSLCSDMFFHFNLTF